MVAAFVALSREQYSHNLKRFYNDAAGPGESLANTLTSSPVPAPVEFCPGRSGPVYKKNGEAIFDRTTAQKISSAGGILHQKYSQDALYELLTTYFGDATLDKLIRPSLITAYDITDRCAIFLTSADARTDDIYNFYVRDVARATSAAPTYFSPAHIKSINKQIFSLVDGGMFANNPALCAYAEARKLYFSKLLNDPQKKDKPARAGEPKELLQA